jgi:hypothetical protein
MDDRGEKIVNLAREILHATPEEVSPSHSGTPVSFTKMCLIACIAALAGSGVTAWATETQRPLNAYEKTELEALIAYDARIRNENEQSLKHDLESRLNVASLDDMAKTDFLTARRYLIDRAR